ncbi:MAG: carbon-nitrogen hydrolase family protein [Euryarchaeota archaeon]|nr:carbon-nitrogen hydrolase family protein [Euryarchaeota archaeon]
MSSFNVAVIQHPPVFLNIEKSLERASILIEEATDHGASVIVFPETWLPGYPVWLDFSPKAALWNHTSAKALYRRLVDNALTLQGDHFKKLRNYAKEFETYIVMGVHERLGGTLYNTMVYLGKNGKEFKVHRKILPTYTERMIWGRGDGSTLGVLSTEYGNIGGLVCWEHWMPLTRAAMHAQHETLHVAQWPAVKELHHIASRHYAFEGQCFVAAAGGILSKEDIIEGFNSQEERNKGIELLEAIPAKEVLNGGSAVIAPNTKYITGPVFDKRSIIYADIDPESIAEGHLVLDTDGHYSRPDIFHLNVNEEEQRNVSFGSRKE